MAIVYTFDKSQDQHILGVSQDTNFELYYTSDNSNSLVCTGAVLNGSTAIMETTKDGKYNLVLIVTGETNVEIEFDVIKYLQDSIIEDARLLICGKEGKCAETFARNCLKKSARECLTHKSVFVKLLTFQTLYIPLYGANYSLIFCNFLEEGAATYNCKLQTTINNILKEECLTGGVRDVSKLFNLYLSLYWAGMYFIEENLAGDDTDELAFIKQKFHYDEIVACMCGSCINIEDLKPLFTVNPTITDFTFFQFDDVSYDINNIDLLTDAYLVLNGAPTDEDEMVVGRTFVLSNIGRIGFVLTNVLPDRYAIYDTFNNDITDTVFDKVYNSNTLVETYVSKEHYITGNIFLKFVIN